MNLSTGQLQQRSSVKIERSWSWGESNPRLIGVGSIVVGFGV